MMYSVKWLLVLSVAMLFFSCAEKEEPEVFVHVHNATIKVTVNLEQGGLNGQYTYTPISGVVVDLYKTEEDRTDNIDLVFTRTTDSGGLAVFENLEEEYYYLRISHPTYGTMLDETSTPDGTVSFVQVYY
jgi:hypothetical protein